jgi:hypothetical protein
MTRLRRGLGERAQRVSHASGAENGVPASERAGESEGQRPSETQ